MHGGAGNSIDLKPEGPGFESQPGYGLPMLS